VVITNLLRTAYSLADTFWLGRLSKEALAAITFSYPLVFLFIALGMGVSVAGSVLVAQNEGAQNKKEVEYITSQTLVFSIVVALILGGVGLLLLEPILQLLNVSPEVLPLVVEYLRVVLLGMSFMFGFSVFIALMRGYGDTLTPMLIMLGAVVLNIIIDPAFIFGWGFLPAFGIKGAAIATVLSRGLAFAVGLYILFKGNKGPHVKFSYLRPKLKFLKKIFKIGLPASIEGSGRALSINALMAVVGTFSTAVVAGYGIGTRVFSMVFLPALAVSRSVETATGQNIGAGKFDRAKQANYLAAKTMFLIMLVFGILCFIFASQIVSVLTTQQEVIEVSSEFLRYISLTFGFYGAARVFRGGLRGAGRTGIAAITSIITLGVIRLPMAWYLSSRMGPKGIWYGFVISNIAALVLVWVCFKTGIWKRGVINQEKGEVAEELSEIEETISE